MVEASFVNYAELGVLAIGVVIALQQLRDIKQTRKTELETRQAQLFMELYNRYSTKEFRQQVLTVRNIYSWTDYEDFMSKYGLLNNPDAYSNISSLFTYFHGLGVLVEKELIDVKLVADLMGHTIVDTWEKYESQIQEYRRRSEAPSMWEHVEYLYNQVKPLAFQPSFP